MAQGETHTKSRGDKLTHRILQLEQEVEELKRQAAIVEAWITAHGTPEGILCDHIVEGTPLPMDICPKCHGTGRYKK